MERKDSVTNSEPEAIDGASSIPAGKWAAAPTARDFAMVDQTKTTTTSGTVAIKAGKSDTRMDISMWKRIKVKAFNGMQAMGSKN